MARAASTTSHSVIQRSFNTVLNVTEDNKVILPLLMMIKRGKRAKIIDILTDLILLRTIKSGKSRPAARAGRDWGSAREPRDFYSTKTRSDWLRPFSTTNRNTEAGLSAPIFVIDVVSSEVRVQGFLRGSGFL